MSFHLRIRINFLPYLLPVVGSTFSAGVVLLSHSEYYTPHIGIFFRKLQLGLQISISSNEQAKGFPGGTSGKEPACQCR